MVSVDDILVELGEFGLDQKINYLLYCLPFSFTTMHLVSWVFIGAEVPHRCHAPDSDLHGFSGGLAPTLLFQDDGNGTDSNWELNACTRKNLLTNVTEPCKDGYDYEEGLSSVTKEWDLVCSREKMRATIESAPMVGNLLGCFAAGVVVDAFGRKPVFIGSIIFMLGSGILSTFSPNYFSFVLSRAMNGFARAGLDTTSYIMCMEVVGPNKRTIAGVLCWLFETLGQLMTAGLAYLIKDNWRLLQAVYTAPLILFTIYWWIAPESVRWLVIKGRCAEARKLIEKSEQRNKVKLPKNMIEDMEHTIKEEISQRQAGSIMDLYRSRNLFWKTIIMSVVRLVCCSLYYALLLDQSELSENLYIGFCLNSAVQIPGYIFIAWTMAKDSVGRRITLFAMVLLSGLASLTHPFITHFYLKIAVSLTGRFCANCSLTAIFLYTAELLPTSVRGSGFNIVGSMCILGSFVAPYIQLLDHYAPCVFGAAGVVTGFFVLLLPETLGQPLPQTVSDGEKLPIGFKNFCRRKEPLSTQENKPENENKETRLTLEAKNHADAIIAQEKQTKNEIAQDSLQENEVIDQTRF